MKTWSSYKKTILETCKELSLVANIELNTQKKSGYSFKSYNKSISKVAGWVYLIVIDGELIKIGKTETTLSKRLLGYGSGTEENRLKGTCSTTNYFISQRFLEAIDNNHSIEIWAFNTPSIETVINVLGEDKTVVFHTARNFENVLLTKYKEMYGEYPALSFNN